MLACRVKLAAQLDDVVVSLKDMDMTGVREPVLHRPADIPAAIGIVMAGCTASR